MLIHFIVLSLGLSYICIDVIQSRRRPNKLLHLLCNTLFSAFWCFSSFTTTYSVYKGIEKYELFLLNSKRSLVLVHFEEKREPFPLYCQFLTYVVSMLSSPFLKTILGTILDAMQWKIVCGIQKLFCFHQNTGKWSLYSFLLIANMMTNFHWSCKNRWKNSWNESGLMIRRWQMGIGNH